jgi:predicted thioesterase
MAIYKGMKYSVTRKVDDCDLDSTLGEGNQRVLAISKIIEDTQKAAYLCVKDNIREGQRWENGMIDLPRYAYVRPGTEVVTEVTIERCKYNGKQDFFIEYNSRSFVRKNNTEVLVSEASFMNAIWFDNGSYFDGLLEER